MANEMTVADSRILDLRGYMDGLWALAKRAGADASACADYAKHMHHAVDRIADELQKRDEDAERYRFLRITTGLIPANVLPHELDAAVDEAISLAHNQGVNSDGP